MLLQVLVRVASQVLVESPQITRQTLPESEKSGLKSSIKRQKHNWIKRSKEAQATEELEDVLFLKFGVKIINYDKSKNKPMLAALHIIEQIYQLAEPLKLTYKDDYFQEKFKKLKESITEGGLSCSQLYRGKQKQIIYKLKRALSVSIRNENMYCKVLSVACNYLNSYLKQTINRSADYVDVIPIPSSAQSVEFQKIIPEACKYLNDSLNQPSDFTTDSNEDVMPVPGSKQPDETQPLFQISMPLISITIEEELTIAEQLALIRLKNALNRYPITEIDIENFRELLFAAAYCIKMNSNMIQVSESDYNKYYVKHFYAPYPYDNPRVKIEDHLDDLEKALSEGSMDLAIKQNLSHQKEALPETGDLENTGLNLFVDAYEPEAMLTTTDSLNPLLENFDDEASSARAKKILAALDLAAQYLENEKYIQLQNLLAYEKLIDNEPAAKKLKSNITV